MTTRLVLNVLHRWLGLTTALFLFTSGVTGAVIAWDHELDRLLNPQLHYVRSTGTPIAPATLAALIEQRDPRVQVTYFPLKAEIPNGSLRFFVAPRIDPATGRRFQISHNQVFLDPQTGEELGRRSSLTSWPITRENVISVLYRFHYSLQIPELFGSNRWGIWLLGAVALLWTFDCFVGLYLTLPIRRVLRATASPAKTPEAHASYWQQWKPAWQIKYWGSAYRITFDIHRAFGLWTWGLLLLIAFTGFSLNLYQEIFVPVLRTVSTYTPTPIDQRRSAGPGRPVVRALSYADVIDRATKAASERGWTMSVTAIGYTAAQGIYNVRLSKANDDDGNSEVAANLYFDSVSGELLGDRLSWKGTAADIFAQAQFPIHSGRILGLPGRILVSLMGLVVAALSVSGVVIWWRKRRARVVRRSQLVKALN